MRRILYPNGDLRAIEHTKNGVYHRLRGPAMVRYYENGKKEEEEWWCNGVHHRNDGPSTRYWCHNGDLGFMAFYVHGKRHRVGAPAIQEWFAGVLGIEYWYQHGEYHREDGPAKIHRNCDGNITKEKWYIRGRELTPEEIEPRLLPAEIKCALEALPQPIAEEVGYYYRKI